MRRALAVATMTLVLAACSNNADKPTAATGPVGGTLRIAITQPGSVDPANAYEPAGRLINELACEPLLTIDPKTNEVAEGLASTWIVSNSGRRLTFRLRKARFSNGSKVTADHVVRSLSRAASEEFAGNTANLLEPIAGFPEISGRADAERERDRQRLRGLTIIDQSSFSIDLARRDADFLRVLAHPVAAPTFNADERNPVCAGPYKLAAPWDPQQTTITLVRNEHYHGTHPVFTNGGRGYPETVEFAVDQQAQADVAAVDFATAKALSPADRHEAPSGHVDYIGLPLRAYGDPAVRRAFAQAIDRSTILEGRPPADGFLPGHRCETTESAAKRPEPTDLKLYFHDEFANRAIAESVAAQWKAKLGVTATPTPITIDDLARKAASPEGVDGAFLMGWQPPVNRPEAYISPLFTSAAIGTTNLSRYVDPELDRILDREARNATDEEDTALGYRSAHQHLCETMPMVPVVLGMSRWKIDSRRVAGATLDVARGWPVLRELYLREGAT